MLTADGADLLALVELALAEARTLGASQAEAADSGTPDVTDSPDIDGESVAIAAVVESGGEIDARDLARDARHRCRHARSR